MMDSLARMIDGKLCVSTAMMLQMFGVSRQALGNWAKQGCPKSKPGWWPLAEVVQWRGLGGGKTSKNDDDLTLGTLKLKYDGEVKRLQAEALELKNSIARGEYVPRTEVVSELSRYFTGLKRALTGLSRMISTMVGPFVDPTTARRIERELADIINEWLEKASAGETYVPTKGRKKKSNKKPA